ncbi:MAG: hypothetical protein KDA81_21805, partial [Planctomycetaceae bacterium]|nr:hypothetical protein [Planctomycetaceae bacterium]
EIKLGDGADQFTAASTAANSVTTVRGMGDADKFTLAGSAIASLNGTIIFNGGDESAEDVGSGDTLTVQFTGDPSALPSATLDNLRSRLGFAVPNLVIDNSVNAAATNWQVRNRQVFLGSSFLLEGSGADSVRVLGGGATTLNVAADVAVPHNVQIDNDQVQVQTGVKVLSYAGKSADNLTQQVPTAGLDLFPIQTIASPDGRSIYVYSAKQRSDIETDLTTAVTTYSVDQRTGSLYFQGTLDLGDLYVQYNYNLNPDTEFVFSDDGRFVYQFTPQFTASNGYVPPTLRILRRDPNTGLLTHVNASLDSRLFALPGSPYQAYPNDSYRYRAYDVAFTNGKLFVLWTDTATGLGITRPGNAYITTVSFDPGTGDVASTATAQIDDSSLGVLNSNRVRLLATRIVISPDGSRADVIGYPWLDTSTFATGSPGHNDVAPMIFHLALSADGSSVTTIGNSTLSGTSSFPIVTPNSNTPNIGDVAQRVYQMSASHDGSTVYISFSTPDSGHAIPIAPANKTVVYHRQTDGSLAWVQSLDLLTTQESPLVFSPDSRFAYRFASWGGLSGSLDQYYMAPFMDVHAVNPDGSLSDPIQRFSGLPTKYTRWQDSLPFVVTNESVSAVGYGSFSIDFYVPPDYVFAAQYVEPFRRDAATGLVSGVQPGGVVVEVQDGDYHFADHLPNDLATIAGTVQYRSLTAARSPVVNNLGTFVYYIDPDQDALVTFRRNTSSGALTKDSALFYPLVPGLADAAG